MIGVSFSTWIAWYAMARLRWYREATTALDGARVAWGGRSGGIAMIHFTVLLALLITLVAAPAGAQQSGVGKAIGDVLSDVVGKDEHRIHAQVVATTGSSLIVKADDGQTYTVDTSSLPAARWRNLEAGRGVTLTVGRGKSASTLVASRVAAAAPGSYPSASPGTAGSTAAAQNGYQRL